ncbi:MAG: OmpA family protein [Bacteroidales bacterium]|nr:OmpA family protein [Bacteroidales bacterium]
MKRIFILFGTLALAFASQAQMNLQSNYIGLNVGGGLNTLKYSPADGDWNLKLGFLGELKYMHFFGKHFGLGFGAQFNYTRSGATFDFTEVTDNLVHPDNGLNYESRTVYNDRKERQNVMFLSIPVELYWRAPIGERWFFLLGLGAQFDLPMSGEYTADEGSYELRGYFPATNVEYRNLPSYGFTVYDANESGDVEHLRTWGVSAIIDLGFNYSFSNHWGLYMGLYGGYGFTNLLDEPSTEPMLDAPNGSTAISAYNGVVNSNQIDELHLLNVGAKIGINFGWQCHSSAKRGDDGGAALVHYEAQNDKPVRRDEEELDAVETPAVLEAPATHENGAIDDEDAQAAEEAAAREARCNARRMNNPDMASAMANIDSDIAEAEQAANESGDASAKEAVANAKAIAADAKTAYNNGKYCQAYDLFNDAYGEIANSYANDAHRYAAGKNIPAAIQAADDADLYAEAAHKDGLDCAMAASRNAKINSEIARDADKADRNAAAYNDPNTANRLAQEAIDMANDNGSKPALTDGKDASGKAYRGNLPESYAAAAKSFAESAEACAAKNGSADAAVREAKEQATEAANAARMGNTAAAYRAAFKAREAAHRACGMAATQPADAQKASAQPADRAELQRLLDKINATVHFDFGKTEPQFDEATNVAINALCKAMAADKNVKVLITGHTDNVGSAEGNMTYGKKRAEALKALMVNRGAPAASISTASRGENDPVVDNDTEEHRYQNRRAVVTLR